MTPQTVLRATYVRPDAATRDLRGIEYELLARATAALVAAWPQRRNNFSALASAIDANLRLWTALGCDVADPGNALPTDLRARLFYLYEFTASHSRTILDGTGGVEVLVDINTAVMRGLRGGGPA